MLNRINMSKSMISRLFRTRFVPAVALTYAGNNYIMSCDSSVVGSTSGPVSVNFFIPGTRVGRNILRYFVNHVYMYIHRT